MWLVCLFYVYFFFLLFLLFLSCHCLSVCQLSALRWLVTVESAKATYCIAVKKGFPGWSSCIVWKESCPSPAPGPRPRKIRQKKHVQQPGIAFESLVSMIFSIQFCTLDFLSKKHVKFGQGLDFLRFSEGNRGENDENRRKNNDKSKKHRQENSNFRAWFLTYVFLI